MIIKYLGVENPSKAIMQSATAQCQIVTGWFSSSNCGVTNPTIATQAEKLLKKEVLESFYP